MIKFTAKPHEFYMFEKMHSLNINPDHVWLKINNNILYQIKVLEFYNPVG